MDEEKNGVFSWTLKVKGHSKYSALCGLTTFGSCRTQKRRIWNRCYETLIEEASRWDLVPKPASLWWTRTYDSEEKVNMILVTTSGCYKFPCEEHVQDLGLRHESAREHRTTQLKKGCNPLPKLFWKDILMYKSKDVPLKVRCQRLVDHVHAVFTYGRAN